MDNQVPRNWLLAPPIPIDIDQELADYHPILRQILFNRNIVTQNQAQQYLLAQPPPGTDSSELVGIALAVERILAAIKNQEVIAIYGDYDADGVTATALLVDFLQRLGARVLPYIPNRFDEGYGLNNDALAKVAEDGTRLVITVDCGVRSPGEAKFARELGLDLIITDHHMPGEKLPDALAVINPKQPNDSYPDKDLAGVGLAYKLAVEVVKQLATRPDISTANNSIDVNEYLDLVAIGTVADMALLVGENRHLVRAGLQRIRKPNRQGIQSLIGVSGLNTAQVTASDIGFMLGPRLNAAGRLDSALAALNLLLSNDVRQAGLLAQQLNNQNRERQQIMRSIQARAEELALAGKSELPLLLFAADSEFNPGIVGLAASRITEKMYRPAIVAYIGDQETRASCRSISEFHITKALDRCADILIHHGGHAAAAGFTVKNEHWPELIERLNAIAIEQLSNLDLRPKINVDLKISLSELKPELLTYLDWLQPTGYGNPQPLFMSEHLKVLRTRQVGSDGSHLRLTVTDGNITYDGIAFRQGAWSDQMPDYIDLIYIFESNEYNGRKSLQLNIRDLRPSSN